MNDQPKPKKKHTLRNILLAVVAVVIVGAVIGSLNGPESAEQAAAGAGDPAAPSASQEAGEKGTKVEVFGTGEAQLAVHKDGMSMNTVQLPHTEELPDGFVTVTVSRTPSVESYMNGGQGDTGEVGCRIIRDGTVVDEKKASGQFASVTCSKYR